MYPAISPEFDMVRGTLKVNAVRDGDAVWISFEAKPKDGAPSAAEINAKKKYPGDPYVPDWAEFAAKHAGWEYRLPVWKLNSLEEAGKIPVGGDQSADGVSSAGVSAAGLSTAGASASGASAAGASAITGVSTAGDVSTGGTAFAVGLGGIFLAAGLVGRREIGRASCRERVYSNV